MKFSDPTVAAALISTGLISLVPNLLLFAFPYYEHGDGGKQGMFLSLGQALAAGGLLGDVFLHTLPHAYMEDHVGSGSGSGSGHGGSEGLWLLFGFTLFLTVDMLIRSMGGGHSHHHHHHDDDYATNTKGGKEKSNSSNAEKQKTAPLWFSSTIVLNLAADALHNFTDGIAIGASFASSSGVVHNIDDDTIWSLIASRGALTTLSVALHEIPHEIGDFSILVLGGFSKHQAILAQFGTALAALLGTLVGLMSAEFGKTDEMMYATAGGFVYLAAVQILPELLEDDTQTLKMRLAQICAFGVGIAFMYSVALLEEHEHGHGNGHHHHDLHGHSHHDLHHGHHGHTHDDEHYHHTEL